MGFQYPKTTWPLFLAHFVTKFSFSRASVPSWYIRRASENRAHSLSAFFALPAFKSEPAEAQEPMTILISTGTNSSWWLRIIQWRSCGRTTFRIATTIQLETEKLTYISRYSVWPRSQDAQKMQVLNSLPSRFENRSDDSNSEECGGEGAFWVLSPHSNVEECPCDWLVREILSRESF